MREARVLVGLSDDIPRGLSRPAGCDTAVAEFAATRPGPARTSVCTSVPSGATVYRAVAPMPRRASVLPIAIREPSRDHAGRSPPNGDVPTGVPSTLTTQTSERVKRAFEPSGDHGGPLTVSIRRVRPETGHRRCRWQAAVRGAARRFRSAPRLATTGGIGGTSAGPTTTRWKTGGTAAAGSTTRCCRSARAHAAGPLPPHRKLRLPAALRRGVGAARLRRPGATPRRSGGVELTFSAPLNLSRGSGILFPRSAPRLTVHRKVHCLGLS